MRVHPKGVVFAVGVVLPLILSVGLVLRAGLDDPPGPDRALESTRPRAARSLDLRFVRDGESRMEVREAGTDRVLRTVTAANGGFLWGILRPLERERERHGAPFDAPYRLTRSSTGRLVLEDPESDLEVELGAFGATSEGLFRSLLEGGPAPAVPSLFPSPPSMEDRP